MATNHPAGLKNESTVDVVPKLNTENTWSARQNFAQITSTDVFTDRISSLDSAVRAGTNDADQVWLYRSGVNGDYGIMHQNTAGAKLWPLYIRVNNNTSRTTSVIDVGVPMNTRNLLPFATNTHDIGAPSWLYKQVYAQNTTISTSDARLKSPVRKLTTNEINAAKKLLSEIGIYQFLDSIEEKGTDNARLHPGLTVQKAIEIMESEGLDPFKYSFICYDQWDAVVREEIADDGEFSRLVTRHKVGITYQDEPYIDIVDGEPILKSKPVKMETPIYTDKIIHDEDGSVVLDHDNNPILHKVPVMEEVEERYNLITVREAGDLYSFRETKLILFILSAILEA